MRIALINMLIILITSSLLGHFNEQKLFKNIVRQHNAVTITVGRRLMPSTNAAMQFIAISTKEANKTFHKAISVNPYGI